MIVFCTLLSCALLAQESEHISVAERNAQQGFNDTIDRLAPDFVLVSLCIADPTDWHDDVLGTTGHAFLRLQCPVFELDYCFSYEGENVNDNLYRYLSGDTKMGMFAVPTDEYIEDYRHWNRSVHEYRLQLPPEAEQRLWEIMDNHLTSGITLRQDLNKYGCAITAVRYVKRALNGTPIIYAPSDFDHLTRREIGYRTLANHPWLRLGSMIFTDSRYDEECSVDEKLIVPADLAIVWQNATVKGEVFATYIGDLVTGETPNDSRPWFTPILLAIILLLISIIFFFTDYPYWSYIMLTAQTIIGVVLIYLWIVMANFGSSAYLLLALFNPLPLIAWKWRKYWALAYAAVLLIGTLILALMPHMIIDPAILVFSFSYIIIYIKEGLPLVRR